MHQKFDEMIDANISKRNGHGLHLIIVCDEAGIFDAFYFVKDRMSDRGNSFLSLIYSVSEKIFILYLNRN